MTDKKVVSISLHT